MRKHLWIREVLSDLVLYSKKNDLPEIESTLRDTLLHLECILANAEDGELHVEVPRLWSETDPATLEFQHSSGVKGR